MEEKEIQDELASIRSIMERSSKFISLSGLSGILAGVYALLGAAAAYWITFMYPLRSRINGFTSLNNIYITFEAYLAIAAAVLILSVSSAYVLSSRRAKKTGQTIWNQTSRALLFHTAVPLVSGGLFVLTLLYAGHLDYIAGSMLVFYGLALVSAGNFTYIDVKYLGILEIVLGLAAACLPGYGLLFWAIGFGVLHIVYGSVMYFKYDR